MPDPSNHSLAAPVRRLLAAVDDTQTDRQLLDRFTVAGDGTAFEAIVRRYGPMVLGVCRRALGVSDTEDVFQSTFLVLARRAATIRRAESLGAWLHGTARRLASKTHAAARRPAPSAGPPALAPDPLAAASWAEVRRLLDEELGALPERYRAPLVLCYLDGLARDEAARRLGWSPRMLKKRLERARALLRARLLRRGVAPAGLAAATLDPAGLRAALSHDLVEATTRTVRQVAANAAPETPAVVLAREALATFEPGRLKVVALGLLAVGLVIGAAVGDGTGPPRPPEPGPDKPTAPRASADAPRLPVVDTPLPEGAIAQLGGAPFRQGDALSDLAFTRDGKLLASAGWDGRVCLWEATSGRELHRTAANQGGRGLAFSADGRWLAAGSNDGSVRIWPVNASRLGQPQTWQADKDGLTAATLTPNGHHLITCGHGGTLLLWDAATDREAGRFQEGKEGAPVLRMALSADGTTLVTAGHRSYTVGADGKPTIPGSERGTIVVWDVAGCRERRRFSTGMHEADAVAISVDGKRIVSGGSLGVAVLWEAETGRELRRFGTSGSGKPKPPAPAPASAKADTAVAAARGRLGAIDSLAFTPDGKTVLVGSGNRTDIYRFDADTGADLPDLTGAPNRIFRLEVSADGKRLASGGDRCRLALWDLAAGTLLTPSDEPGRAFRVAWSPDGRTLSTTHEDLHIRLWDVAEWKLRQRFGSCDGYPLLLHYAPDGRTLTTGEVGGPVRVWEVESGKELHRFKGETACRGPESDIVLVGHQDDVFAYDRATGRERLRLPKVGAFGWYNERLACSPDGRMLAAAGRAEIRLIDRATGKVLQQFPSGSGSIGRLLFSPDGRTLVDIGQDPPKPKEGREPERREETGRIRFWEVATGLERRSIRGLTTHTVTAAFAPDGRVLAVSHHIDNDSDDTIRLWDPFSGRELRCFRGHTQVTASLAFAPDGKTLASAAEDGLVLIWDVRRPPAPAPEATPERLRQDWEALAGDDPAAAYEAIGRFAAAPAAALTFLRERLAPAQAPTADRLAALVADLDSARFAVRSAAAAELRKLDLLAVPALRKCLSDGSAGAREQAAKLLAEAEGVLPAGEALRTVRAIEGLELMHTPAAKDLLAILAKGTAEARITREATAALGHLAEGLALRKE